MVAPLPYVSAENVKALRDFGCSVPGIKATKNFINFQGFQELLKNNLANPFSQQVKTEKDFFTTFENALTSKNVLAETLDSSANSELTFSTLSEIPETVVKANGYIYLLQWNDLGKVGKTRFLRKREKALQQKFKDGILIWFSFCENIDLLEREILQKLKHMGALVKNQGSREIFDPKIISFEQVQQEISRLAEQINSQSARKSEKTLVQKEYLEFATYIVEPILPLGKEEPKAYIAFIEKILNGFEKI